jgi:hypothetical protein
VRDRGDERVIVKLRRDADAADRLWACGGSHCWRRDRAAALVADELLGGATTAWSRHQPHLLFERCKSKPHEIGKTTLRVNWAAWFVISPGAAVRIVWPARNSTSHIPPTRVDDLC